MKKWKSSDSMQKYKTRDYMKSRKHPDKFKQKWIWFAVKAHCFEINNTLSLDGVENPFSSTEKPLHRIKN